MMLYVQTDPQKINNSNLDTRLNNELRTIKPSVMNDDENIPSFREHKPIPIQRKQSLVSETSEILKFYENARQDNYEPNPMLEDSLDNFIMYVKGLKNKFLEDLILNKMQMITDEQMKESLMHQYPKPQIKSDSSRDISLISNQVFAEENNFEDLKEFEKEVDRVIIQENPHEVYANDTLGEPINTPSLGNDSRIEFQTHKSTQPEVNRSNKQSEKHSMRETNKIPPLPPASKISSEVSFEKSKSDNSRILQERPREEIKRAPPPKFDKQASTKLEKQATKKLDKQVTRKLDNHNSQISLKNQPQQPKSSDHRILMKSSTLTVGPLNENSVSSKPLNSNSIRQESLKSDVKSKMDLKRPGTLKTDSEVRKNKPNRTKTILNKGDPKEEAKVVQPQNPIDKYKVQNEISERESVSESKSAESWNKMYNTAESPSPVPRSPQKGVRRPETKQSDKLSVRSNGSRRSDKPPIAPTSVTPSKSSPIPSKKPLTVKQLQQQKKIQEMAKQEMQLLNEIMKTENKAKEIKDKSPKYNNIIKEDESQISDVINKMMSSNNPDKGSARPSYANSASQAVSQDSFTKSEAFNSEVESEQPETTMQKGPTDLFKQLMAEALK